MKETLKFIIGLAFFINNTWSENLIRLDSAFMAKNFTIKINDSLILQDILLNKFLCLQKCLIDTYCLYASYDTLTCSLYSQDALNDHVSSNDKIIYQKSNYELKKKLEMEPFTHSDPVMSCSNSSHFWSQSTNLCTPCKTGFIKYSELPYNCYHSGKGSRNFDKSKSYCQSKGGVLFRPKTQNERFFYIKKFPSKITFVNSTITNVGQIFKWPDGSNVVGFGKGEPNNMGSKKLIEGCLELRSTGYFNDGACSNSYDLIICQQE
ncbi:unnamed protein product [Brachionus calyciflorus]|uniref:C-type lectin domain-containing protein n=1 Tax=Brachionus calyciflorus TaxID=104777 RepID=A0A813N726_9BILA|nr:unnamed protein product [Brachionus calyciflorus]